MNAEQCKYHSQCCVCYPDNDGSLWCWGCVDKEGKQMSVDKIEKPKAVNCTQALKKKCRWGAYFDGNFYYCNYMGDHNGLSRPCSARECFCFKDEKKEYTWVNVTQVNAHVERGSRYRLGK